MSLLGLIGNAFQASRKSDSSFGSSDLGQSINSAFTNFGSALKDSWNTIQTELFPTEKTFEFNSSEAEKNRNFNAEQAEKLNTFNAQEAQKNRDFQERMSNTAYQRALADLKGTGLNPYAVLGVGSSSPSGSAASGYAASGSAASAGSGRGSPLVDLAHSVLNAYLMGKRDSRPTYYRSEGYNGRDYFWSDSMRWR